MPVQHWKNFWTVLVTGFGYKVLINTEAVLTTRVSLLTIDIDDLDVHMLTPDISDKQIS